MPIHTPTFAHRRTRSNEAAHAGNTIHHLLQLSAAIQPPRPSRRPGEGEEEEGKRRGHQHECRPQWDHLEPDAPPSLRLSRACSTFSYMAHDRHDKANKRHQPFPSHPIYPNLALRKTSLHPMPPVLKGTTTSMTCPDTPLVIRCARQYRKVRGEAGTRTGTNKHGETLQRRF